MEKLFLQKDLVTGTTLSPDGVLAYVALRIATGESILLCNKEKSIECISINRLAFLLTGETAYEKALTDGLARGIAELVNGNWISICKDLSVCKHHEYILDLSAMWLNTDKDKFVIITPDEVHKLMTCKEVMKKKIFMLKYYIVLVSTFDGALDRKIGHMSQQYIAEHTGNSVRTCQRYNEILENMQMIFVYRSNGKMRAENKLKQINNCYSRYEDKNICERYASNYEDMYAI